MDNINNLLKATSICLSSNLIYSFISNSFILSKSKNFANVILVIVYFYITNIFLTIIIEPFKTLLIITSISLICSIINNNRFDDTFIYMFVSFSIVYILYIICSFISSAILIAIFHVPKYTLLQIIVPNILLLFFTVLISKRLYLPTPHENKSSIIIIFISVIIYIFYSLLVNEALLTEKAIIIAILGECLCLFILLLWLRILKATIYNKNVYKSSLKQENEKYDKLQLSHSELENKVHNDRKTLLLLYRAIEVLANESKDKQIQLKAIKLLSELKEIRVDKLSQSNYDTDLPISDITIINALFHLMAEIARKNDIDIQFDVDRDISKVLNHISISQLESLLADLMENAIIAEKECINKNKNISVYFGLKDGCYQFSITDNGVPFEPETLKILGKQRTTTHRTTGGSGIGYMAIFEILESTNASLIIDQQIGRKNIIVVFDGESNFIVKECS